ncbi:MAG: prenyltransferase/squalene oxidase repeat-containing protein [Phycisphaerae bacterium]
MTELLDRSTSNDGRAKFAAVASSLIVLGVIAGGVWVIAYGLPSGEVANWWVFASTLCLLILAIAGFRYVDPRRMSLLKKCLIVSVLLHVLIALLFSAVGVTHQIVRWVRNEPMTPAVNVQLSREFEVREQVRQQVANAPSPTKIAETPQQHVDSPLPPAAPTLAPAGVPRDELRQLSSSQNPIAPTIPSAPPAPDVETPLLPVRPEITPMRTSTPLPAPQVEGAHEQARMPGPVDARLGRATSPVLGAGIGSLGAPPASLAQGEGSGGHGAGSGTGRAYSMLTNQGIPGESAHTIDHLPPPIAPPVVPSNPGAVMPQRSFDERQRALEKFGGTPETEAAVSRALAYLSRMQQPDGHWTKVMGEMREGDKDAHDTALTGLSVLCFLASNHTPNHAGPYQQTVRKGIDYLIAREGADGDLRGDGNMYDQGIASLAMGEAAAMTNDARIIEASHRAAQFILDAQNGAGAWRYSPRDLFTDTSVTGWQVMALHSAERTGFKIPDEVRRKVFDYLGSVSTGREGMLAGYLTALPTSTMTAEATFARLLLGQQISAAQAQEVADYLDRKLPSRDSLNFYYIYYGSLALMQLQGEPWRRWNARMSRLLLELQDRTGATAGSWTTDSEWGSRGGRIYTTALATLSLEVYYRYAPMKAAR